MAVAATVFFARRTRLLGGMPILDSFQVPLSQEEAWLLDSLLTAPITDVRRLSWLDTLDIRLVRDQIGQVLLKRRDCLQLTEAQLDLVRKLVPTWGDPWLTSVARPLKIKLHSDMLETGMWEYLGIS
jgi:hypothetical protein